uniref:Eukaryotic translation initiation factor 3 subunit D n=1 Tax=Ciona intestinalis TaxID=7719 RepID=F6XIP9_CIOIN|nr:eukaryotic translation initiation factor 3 subunit D-like [Ciona intestinalis]|eukprot:XP_002126137.1 eukaryotic translation initiation factor 3 subunit D-like [Ciona intestinalis]
MAHFIPPTIQDNPEGWGPRSVPEKFKDMPFQPFSKGDRLGKVSDWSGNTYQDRRYMNKYNSQFGYGNQYSYFHEEDESTFRLVDNTKIQKPAYQRNRFRFNQLRQRQMQQRQQREAGGNANNQKPFTKLEKRKERERQRMQRNMQKQYGQSRFRWKERQMQNQQKRRDASVNVGETWEVLEEMDFNRLSKLKLPDIEDPVDLYKCGELLSYDRAYDRVSVKAEKPLKRFNKEFHKVTTTDDPIIRKLAKSNGNVYATDAILATLMCCTRSQYSWDIIAQRVGKNKLFFDKRDDSNFDLLTVSETANEPPQDEGMNSPHNLAMEATYINHNFSQQVLKQGDKHQFEKNNPFVQGDTENIASVGYRYRKWNLGNNIELVSRTEHDAVLTASSGELSYINVKALNEWDYRCCNGVEWRRKLDSQRGSVLATELKNNSSKLAKWTMCALLAGSEYLKMGYVSRYNIQDSSKHVVIGTQQFIPKEFASQINLSVANAWGILRCIIDLCMKQKEGKYLILKDPNKPVIRLYSLPEGTFSSDEEEEDDDSGEEESSDEEEK